MPLPTAKKPTGQDMTVDDTIELAMHQHRYAARQLGIHPFGGRPTKYREECAELAYNILCDFRTVTSLSYLAAILGISRSTLYEWQHRYPDFARAIFGGKAVQEGWLASQLLDQSRNPQGTLILLYVLHGWRKEGRRSQDGSNGLREALEAQAAGARRVVWDK